MKKRGIEKDMEDNIIKGKKKKNNILIGEFAKELDNGMGPKKFFQWLREQGYLSPNKDITYNLPTRKSKELGLITVKETILKFNNGITKRKLTPLITEKGQEFFKNKFIEG